MATRQLVKGGIIRRYVDPSQSSAIPGIRAHFDIKPRWLMGSLSARIENAQQKLGAAMFVAAMIYYRVDVSVRAHEPQIPSEHEEGYSELYGTKWVRIAKDLFNPFKERIV